MKVLIIIPAYNEAENIEKTVNDVIQNTDYDYVVVNDCSKDNTKEVCEKNNFNMLSLPINYGLTSGIQIGMKYAYKNNYDIAIQFDGDGQHSSNAIIISAPKSSSVFITDSGVNICLLPSKCDLNSTPSSEIVLKSPKLNTWNPPLSVNIGLSQFINL